MAPLNYDESRLVATFVAQLSGIFFYWFFTRKHLYREHEFIEARGKMIRWAEIIIVVGTLAILLSAVWKPVCEGLKYFAAGREAVYLFPNELKITEKQANDYINLLAYLNLMAIALLIGATGGFRSPYLSFYTIVLTVFFILGMPWRYMETLLWSVILVMISIFIGTNYVRSLTLLDHNFLNSSSHIKISNAMIWYGFLIVFTEIILSYYRQSLTPK